jgi:hypothetical protein
MIDSGVTAADAPPSSPFDRLPADFRDLDANDLDGLGPSLEDLSVCCCKPNADETNHRLLPEAVPMDKQFLVDAMPTTGEQL